MQIERMEGVRPIEHRQSTPHTPEKDTKTAQLSSSYLEVLDEGPRANKLLIEEGDDGRTLQGAIPEGSP